jgi:hypothetical protein
VQPSLLYTIVCTRVGLLRPWMMTLGCPCLAACRVGMQPPTITVRYRNMSALARMVVTDRSLPTLGKVIRNQAEVSVAQHGESWRVGWGAKAPGRAGRAGASCWVLLVAIKQCANLLSPSSDACPAICPCCSQRCV